MAVSDVSITLAAIALWEAPAGDVRLSDGGVVKFDAGAGVVSFESEDAIFGTIASVESFETGVGDTIEASDVAFAPNPDAALSDWWRTGLEGSRLRIWLGEIAADGVSLTGEELIADWLVDNPVREQGVQGQDLLRLPCASRLQRLFEIRQGNVCSDRFHQSIWPGERGFENSHDGPQYFAWGTESPPSPRFGGGGGGSSPGNNNGPDFVAQ